MLFSDHNGSLERWQPGAEAICMQHVLAESMLLLLITNAICAHCDLPIALEAALADGLHANATPGLCLIVVWVYVQDCV